MIGGKAVLRFGAILSALVLAFPAQAQTPAPGSEPVFATVNGTAITQRDFHTAYANHVRNKFYHREGVAEERLLAARQEVADQLIERILLLEEIERRKIQPNQQQVDEAIAGYEKRYAGSPMWQQNRETLLPGLKERLSEQSRLEILEKDVRRQSPSTPAELKKFYDDNPKLFTEPEKLRLHTILLKVDPSSPAAAWDAAREEAARIVARLRGGASFEELARIHSMDKSAESGGDMGYLHLGMLPEPLQARVDKLEIGVVGDPVDVLEGIGVFRLDERVPARHRSLEDVADRARDLLMREKENQAWRDFLAQLRAKADIKYLAPAMNAANAATKPIADPATNPAAKPADATAK